VNFESTRGGIVQVTHAFLTGMVSEIEFCGVLDGNDDIVFFDSFYGASLVSLPDGFRFDVR
jgi:hypothetical protein